MPRTIQERFWSRVLKTETCWLWQGALSYHGYGRFYPAVRRGIRVHRYAYELLVGPVPDGLELDHLCRNRACVNPAHLEPVTHRENTLRGNTIPAKLAKQTHCIRGHSLGPPAARARVCLLCQNERSHAYVARKFGRTVRPRAPITHCPHGHEYTPENTTWYKNTRYCKECNRQKARAYYERKRTAV